MAGARCVLAALLAVLCLGTAHAMPLEKATAAISVDSRSRLRQQQAAATLSEKAKATAKVGARSDGFGVPYERSHADTDAKAEGKAEHKDKPSEASLGDDSSKGRGDDSKGSGTAKDSGEAVAPDATAATAAKKAEKATSAKSVKPAGSAKAAPADKPPSSSSSSSSSSLEMVAGADKQLVVDAKPGETAGLPDNVGALVFLVGMVLCVAIVISYFCEKMEHVMEHKKANFFLLTFYKEMMVLGAVSTVLFAMSQKEVLDDILSKGTYDASMLTTIHSAIGLCMGVRMVVSAFIIVNGVNAAEHCRLLERKVLPQFEASLERGEGEASVLNAPGARKARNDYSALFQDVSVCGLAVWSRFAKEHRVLRTRFLLSTSARGHHLDFDVYMRECIGEMTARLCEAGSLTYCIAFVCLCLYAFMLQTLPEGGRSFNLARDGIFLLLSWGGLLMAVVGCVLTFRISNQLMKRAEGCPDMPAVKSRSEASEEKYDESLEGVGMVEGRAEQEQEQGWALGEQVLDESAKTPNLALFPGGSTSNLISVFKVAIFLTTYTTPVHLMYFVGHIASTYHSAPAIKALLNVLLVAPPVLLLFVVLPKIIPRLALAVRVVELDDEAAQAALLSAKRHAPQKPKRLKGH